MAEIHATKTAHARQRRQVGRDGPTNKERDYLEVISYLAQRDEPVIAAHVARWLNLQPPTVSHALQEIEKKGYITRGERSEIVLTEEGSALATAIIRRHRLLETFLADVIGIPWHALHEEAAQLEHVLSPMLERRIEELVSSATTCPHGNPIPGTDAPSAGSTRLDRAQVGTLFTVRRIEEEAEEQTDLLRYLELHRLLPGGTFFVTDSSPTYGVTLRSCNRDATLSPEIAAVIWGDTQAVT